MSEVSNGPSEPDPKVPKARQPWAESRFSSGPAVLESPSPGPTAATRSREAPRRTGAPGFRVRLSEGYLKPRSGRLPRGFQDPGKDDEGPCWGNRPSPPLLRGRKRPGGAACRSFQRDIRRAFGNAIPAWPFGLSAWSARRTFDPDRRKRAEILCRQSDILRKRPVSEFPDGLSGPRAESRSSATAHPDLAARIPAMRRRSARLPRPPARARPGAPVPFQAPRAPSRRGLPSDRPGAPDALRPRRRLPPDAAPVCGRGPGSLGAGVRPDLGRAPRPALSSPSRAAAPRGASSRAAPVFRPPRRRSRGALRSSGGSGPARRLLRATSNQTGSSGGQDIVWRSRYRDRTIIRSGRPGSFGTESALTGPSAAPGRRPRFCRARRRKPRALAPSEIVNQG